MRGMVLVLGRWDQPQTLLIPLGRSGIKSLIPNKSNRVSQVLAGYRAPALELFL